MSEKFCERCEATACLTEDDFGTILCAGCAQSAAEAAWERLCEDFHDGGSTAPWPDTERHRQEEARKLK